MASKLLLLALAGAAGTVTRFGISAAVNHFFPSSFPPGTLIVNTAGCFLAGFFWMLFEMRWMHAAESRTILFVGFMGAFTTFSAVMMENSELLRSAAWMPAALHLSLHNLLGIVAVFAGAALGRLV
ncbi:MAG TPA: CrcB family protein [Candidatus Hydrogenedentes bacterium]|nr:CrcB family protein [Candidatus Hydrogenedentota bacterium]HOM48094.1 CrcB family protein [Candidatus Hydrogenedentota bacterium]HOR51180.1 CrcB family protein [Candidatus Hydrogenedentota bacterium]HPK25231.1 CrcB family protein [Candidatus Hydrogenedentota bacterium]